MSLASQIDRESVDVVSDQESVDSWGVHRFPPSLVDQLDLSVSDQESVDSWGVHRLPPSLVDELELSQAEVSIGFALYINLGFVSTLYTILY